LTSTNDELIILISGFNFGEEDPTEKFALSRKLFLNLVQGNLSNSLENQMLSKRLKKVFIIGNLISPPEDSDLVQKGSYAKQKLNTLIYKQLLQSYDEADYFLNLCSNSISTYLMPGEKDISSSYYPQVKMSPLMFIHSKQNIERTLFLKANPFNLEICDFSFLITSGQNVDNIRKFSLINKISGNEENSALKIMEKVIDWGHLCPCAPDTLRTWPVKKEDPMVLNEIPNVFIVGNQKYFEEDFVKYKNDDDKIIKLISVPNFKDSFSFVIMNPKSLECLEYKIELD
jgi:DNA polymerase delta subunit 2